MTEQQPRVETRRIYVRDLSFESPHAAEGTGEWKPELNLNLAHSVHMQSDDLYEVRLRCTLTCRNNHKVVYVVEVDQAGLFSVTGFAQEQLKVLLNTFCPNMLFPYTRETVDSLVVKGGFPPVVLTPINFDQLYAQSLRERAQQDKDKEKPTTH